MDLLSEQGLVGDFPPVRRKGHRSCSLKVRRYRLPKGHFYAIDTREQLPYQWTEPCETLTIPAGDYSIANLHEDGVTGERKTLADILGCVPNGGPREREERKFARMHNEYQYRFLIVEASTYQITLGKDPAFHRTKVTPNALLGTLEAWSLRYQMPVWFCKSRKEGSETMQRLLWRAFKDLVLRGLYIAKGMR